MHWMGILESVRLCLPGSTTISGLVFCMISPFSFVGVIFTSGRRILPLPPLVCCSQLITQLSASLYSTWTL